MPDGTIHAEGMAAEETRVSTAAQSGAVVLAGHLLAAAKVARAATMRKGTIPVLTHLRVEADGGSVRIQGTDMERHAATAAPAQGSLPPTTVSASVLVDLLSRLPAEAEVQLEQRGADKELGRLVLRAPRLTVRALAYPPEDFPAAQDWKVRSTFSIPVPSLRRLFTLPAHAISTEETRFYLNGLYLHIATAPEVRLCTVATDGHRLALAEEPLPSGAEEMPSIIVPRHTVAMIRGLLTQRATGHVRVEVSDQAIRFSTPAWTVTSKAIDGTFPDWQRVVPHIDQARHRLKVPDPRGFIRLLEAAGCIATERSRPVRFERRRKDATVWVTMRSPDEGEAELQIPHDVASWDGDGVETEVGFQLRYLRDLAQAVPGGLTFHIQDGSAPMRAEFPAGLGVLMPMRV
ncbi:DNA polymerase III subunit beta [Roseomonas populi]|uniref:Beta sliding clamp n=1 Tax=Roseomonas populi TaxID=3121582 RepID=A0ABT1X134_9PROT|nr:DNA polymerase III subunit beta [Roseomonas pecuniae]MCR0981818.1 DNA polymerase III subunit beta [Roseomonas pecuniae]